MSLNPTWTLGDLVLTDYPFAVQFGSDYGTPETTTDILRSLLSDGDLEVTTHRGNRTVTLPVLIEGADMAVLAEAEAALEAECSRARNELLCDPGDGFGAPFIFDVFGSPGAFARDDDFERAGYRAYTLTFRALPSVRSTVLTTVAALTSGSTTATVDNGSSATGWTGVGTVASVSGAIRSLSSAVAGVFTSSLTRTGSIDTSVTKYLQVDWAVSGGDTPTAGVTVTADGVQLRAVGPANAAAGFVGTVFYVAANSIAALTISATTSNKAIPAARSLRVDNVKRTDVSPTVGSPRQQTRAWVVEGSAPTEGNIALEHGSTSLGQAIIYTRPDAVGGYVPAMRSYLTSSGTTTTDSTLVSGARTDPSTTSLTYTIPSTALPRGTYQVYARVRSTTATAQTFQTQTFQFIGTKSVGGQTVTTQVPFAGASLWSIVCLADGLSLPAADMPVLTSSSVLLQITQTTSTGSPTTALDEVWLFEMESGALTIVNCGTDAPLAGDASNRLWVESPNADRPGWGVFMGTAADQTDAYFPGDVAVKAYPTHVFPPGPMTVFTVTSNPTTAAACSLSYYKRWLNNAAS